MDRPQPCNLSMISPNFVVEVNEVQRGTHLENFGIRYLSIFILLNFSAIFSEKNAIGEKKQKH